MSDKCEYLVLFKYFDYSAAGLPVIMDDLRAMRELHKRKRNGILVSPDCSPEAVGSFRFLFENLRHGKSMDVRGT